MYRFALLFLALILAGCTAQKPTNVVPVTFTVTKTKIVNHYVYVTAAAPRHPLLLASYAAAEAAEKPIVLHGSAPVILKLSALDTATAKAFGPIKDPDHHATPAEVKNAFNSLVALKAFIATH